MWKSKDEQVILISRIPGGTDDDGNPQDDKEKRVPIFAETGSPVRDEYYGALKNGIEATLTVTINKYDFDLADQEEEAYGRETVRKAEFIEYNNKEYKIKRSFPVTEDDLQLTCSEVE